MSKKIKVILVLLSVVTLAFITVSCGGKSQQEPTTQPKPETQTTAPAKPETQPSQQTQQAQPQATAQAPAPSAGKPKIEAVDPVFDFGEKSNIEKVEHEFTIKNTGDALLQISRVTTSCGCTVAQPEKKELQPGESTVVKATLNLAGRVGPLTKTITVFSNDPDNPQLTLEFKGVVKSLIAIEPDRLVQFGEFPSDEKPEPKTVDVRSVDPALKFNITKVEMGEDNPFDYKLETVEEGKHYRITFSLVKALPLNQNIYKRVTIQTDAQLEGKPEEAVASLRNIIVTLSARALGPIEVQPPTLTVRVGDEEAPQPGQEASQAGQGPQQKVGTTSQYVRVRGIKDKEFKITEVVPPDPQINVDINERDKGDFILKISNIPRDENLNGKKFIIKTTSQFAPELELNVKTIKYPVSKFPKPMGSTSSSNVTEALKKALDQKKDNLPVPPNVPKPPKPPVTPQPATAPQNNPNPSQ